MKEATGELNMTVLVVIAIAAVAGLFYVFVWPMIQRTIVQQTCNVYGTGYEAVKLTGNGNDSKTICGASSDRTDCWACCKEGTSGYSTANCEAVDSIKQN